MTDPERSDRDLTSEPIPFRETDERLQGYALGCLQSCTSIVALAALLVLVVLAILFL